MRMLTLILAAAALLPAQTALPPDDLNRVKAGDAAPAFRLKNAEGADVELAQFRGKKVVLVVYRGQW